MKVLVALTFEANQPEDVVPILQAIDPPNLPHFAGLARVVVDPHASAIEQWLDGQEES